MRPKTARPTIKEVASVAGVSIQTVSRVMNERPDVSPETRKRVQEVIKDLGYQPSALARSLIRQRSHTLGVVTAGLKYIGPSRTLSGITAAAEEVGYSLLFKELPSFDDKRHRAHLPGSALPPGGWHYLGRAGGRRKPRVGRRSQLDLDVPSGLSHHGAAREHLRRVHEQLSGRAAGHLAPVGTGLSTVSGISPARWTGGRPASAWRPGGMH